MNFDFAQLDIKKTKNTRKAGSGFKRSQEYTGIKYQVNSATGSKPTFVVSNSLWEQLGLDSKALMFGVIGGKVFVGVVPEEHSTATLFNTRKGEKKTKSTIAGNLEAELIAAGILNEIDPATVVDKKPSKQFLSLEQAEGTLPAGIEAMYEVVADTGSQSEDEEGDGTHESEAPVAEAEAEAPVEADSDEDDEDFL